MKIRTITLGFNGSFPIDPKVLMQYSEILEQARYAFEQAGYAFADFGRFSGNPIPKAGRSDGVANDGHHTGW